MTNVSSEICFEIRRARQAANLSQSELAKEVGCLQSALSMFEKGQPTKLNAEVVEKLAKRFNLEITPKTIADEVQTSFPIATSSFPTVSEEQPHGFCPNQNCPSNKAYFVEGLKRLMPNREMADPVGGRFCAVCGEILEKRCPNCGAPIHAGAICSYCGKPYLAV